MGQGCGCPWALVPVGFSRGELGFSAWPWFCHWLGASPTARDTRMKEPLFLEVTGSVTSFCVAQAKIRHLSVFGRDVILQVPVC